MTYQKLAGLGLFLLVAGCGFHPVNDGGDMNGQGGAGGSGGGGGSGGSGGGGGGRGSDMGGSASCALPQLIITVADVSGNNVSGAQLRRFSLAGTAPSPCKSLTANMLIGAGVFVSTYFAPGVIASADTDSVYLIDANRDLLITTVAAPSSGNQGTGPLEAFPMKDASGKDFGAIAFGAFSNPDYVIEVVGWDAKGNTVGNSPWCASGTACGSGSNLMLGLNVLGMAANPANPSHLLAVDNSNNVAAVDVNPFTQMHTMLVAGNSADLQKAYAVSFNGKPRVAWVNSMVGATPPTSVSYYTDTGAGGTPTLGGPLRCQSGCSTILRAVPDPTSATDFFLLCDGTPSNGRSVVRLKGDGTCTSVFEGLTLPIAYQLRHLAIAQ